MPLRQAPGTIHQAGLPEDPMGRPSSFPGPRPPLPPSEPTFVVASVLWHHHGHQSGPRSQPSHFGALWVPRQSSSTCFEPTGQLFSTHTSQPSCIWMCTHYHLAYPCHTHSMHAHCPIKSHKHSIKIKLLISRQWQQSIKPSVEVF